MSKLEAKCPKCEKEVIFSYGGDVPAWQCPECESEFYNCDLIKEVKRQSVKWRDYYRRRDY